VHRLCGGAFLFLRARPVARVAGRAMLGGSLMSAHSTLVLRWAKERARSCNTRSVRHEPVVDSALADFAFVSGATNSCP
jgi:hypothetical protein